jgi:hypothetical protein
MIFNINTWALDDLQQEEMHSWSRLEHLRHGNYVSRLHQVGLTEWRVCPKGHMNMLLCTCYSDYTCRCDCTCRCERTNVVGKNDLFYLHIGHHLRWNSYSKRALLKKGLCLLINMPVSFRYAEIYTYSN